MSSRSILAGSGLVITLLACTAYTSSSDDDDDDAPVSSASSSGPGGSSTSSGQTGSSGNATSGGATSGSSASSSTSSGALTAFEQELLDGFNAGRANAQPTPAPPLDALYWDTNAATECKGYTDQCERVETNGVVGGSGTTVGSADIVNLFVNDGANYDYASNTCSNGATNCLFWKVLTMRSVNRVGCATTACADKTYFACRFSPTSNPADQPY